MQFASSIGLRPVNPLLRLTLKGFFYTLLGFSLFRFLLILLNHAALGDLAGAGLLLQTLLWGVRGDLYLVVLLFAIPFVLALLVDPAQRIWRAAVLLIALLMGLVMQLSLLVSSLDVPFFMHFFSRLTNTFVNWMDQPGFLISMVTQEQRFWWFIGLFALASLILWSWLVVRVRTLFRGANGAESRMKRWQVYSILMLLLFFSLILRNRLVKKQVFTERSSMVATIPLLDKISQNPLLTLAYSFLSPPASQVIEGQMGLEEAFGLLSRDLERPLDRAVENPLTATHPGRLQPSKYNVVLVLMESINERRFASDFMPQLQRIAAKGSHWTQFFAVGVHTYAGIYGTLCSLPVLMRQHAMKWDSAKPYPGLGSTLAQAGYQTLFFTTHDHAFDNMGRFLSMNGFDRVISQSDYPLQSTAGTFGVSDHVMFEHALDTLDDRGGETPFLAVLLTSSNHAPYRLPGGLAFKPSSGSLPEQVLQYSDWALGRFFDAARSQAWGERTIFLFLGDHGYSGDYRFHLPYSMVNIPLIMVGPTIESGLVLEVLGSQLDVAPTIMGVLGLPYRDEGLGVDLFSQKRVLAPFCSDEHWGCTDGRYYYAFGLDEAGFLFDMRGVESSIPLKGQTQRAKALRQSAIAQWRLAQWRVKAIPAQ